MEDLISRQAAIDAVDEIESEVAEGEGFLYEKWRSHFCSLPSAQPYTEAEIQTMQDLEQAQFDKIYQIGFEEGKASAQPERTGRWLPDNNSVYEMRFVCSECKESQVVPTIGFTKYEPIWDFCPLCGADMRGKQDE